MRAPTVVEVDRWSAYGSDHRFEQRSVVPGGASLLVKPLAGPGETWASGAVLPIDTALAAGQRMTAIFWARADHAVRVPVTLQANSEPYSRFAEAEIELNPAWQRFAITGIAPADLPAGSQLLSVQLGKTPGNVALGPVLFTVGSAEPAAVDAAFARFRPASLAEDVRIASGTGVMLAGTLRLPVGCGRGPYPVALLLNGAGPNTRGGWEVLAKRLQANGIATLEYDKRGTGQSTGKFDDMIPLIIQDAAAAVAFLRTDAAIDTRRIAVVGLSQGGVVAPAVAAADRKIAAVVILAGAVDRDHGIALEQLHKQLAASGVAGGSIEGVVTAIRRLLDARAQGAEDAQVEPLRRSLVDAFVAGGLSQTDAEGALGMIDAPNTISGWTMPLYANLAGVHAPVLALYADGDTLMPSVRILPLAKAALSRNADATVALIPGVNHIFQHGAKTGGAEEFGKLGPPAGAPEVVVMIGNWLDARLKADQRNSKGRRCVGTTDAASPTPRRSS